ncbi:MAG: amino acid ABC transporter permease [Rubrivivax sp.]|jgi:general L-amino acid transport system permease protein|nr:amino acid ABC transporter permease [Betaproteobacteria bacterium]MBP6317212.1 amino acid ABC transporter permease [Rubrivivax sp.]MBK7277773.1 amino acid ABC transporter permease [Betaproteobacteria bacterium]MBK7514099.1 amino acid ABC transporter permease [Betaproteobacteria bacterium]MBK8105675.1 amino acid ABC transporter permease [Betaproteobacteria bacterium]
MADTFQPVAPRPAPVRTEGFVPWVKRNLFADWKNGLTTVLLVALALALLPGLVHWGLTQAVFPANAEACQAARGSGACWGVIAEKWRVIIFGRYPFEQQWRPEIATVLMVAALMASCVRWFWKPWLALMWAAVLAVFFGLMGGGVLGLEPVRTDLWGGLPLTVMLAALSIFLAFPLSVLVALGRRSKLPAIRTVCVVYIELIRGVPLISVLFMASFMFPLFMPQGMTIDVLVRVLVGITLFAAAYMAEIVRGGLQAIPKGQLEAADTLGLSYWQTQRKIVLPQALAMVVPSMMNNFISIFKDTSLVTIVSLYELTGALSLALNSDVEWRPFKIEAYLFITAIYFSFCFAMSRYSLWVEKQVSVAKTR